MKKPKMSEKHKKSQKTVKTVNRPPPNNMKPQKTRD